MAATRNTTSSATKKQPHSTASTSVLETSSSSSSSVWLGHSAAESSSLSSSSSSSITAAAVTRPSVAALRTLFVASAVPMVGFGAMDNFVMIQAGQYIDSTLGVQLGLATMTAAAAGQVVSDVSGVIFGGTLERLLTKLSWIQAPSLTTQQRQLPLARNVAMAGAVVGVVIGCALGATTLLWVDLDARDRIQRAGQLRDIIHDMILAQPPPTQQQSLQHQQQQQSPNEMGHEHESETETAGGFRTPCSSCTVYIADASHDTMTLTDDNSSSDSNNSNRSSSHNSSNSPISTTTTRLKRMKDADSPIVQQSAETGRLMVSSDRHTLYVPVRKHKSTQAGEIMAVVALEAAAHQSGFVEEDVVAAQIMARHIAIFMDRLSD